MIIQRAHLFLVKSDKVREENCVECCSLALHRQVLLVEITFGVRVLLRLIFWSIAYEHVLSVSKISM